MSAGPATADAIASEIDSLIRSDGGRLLSVLAVNLRDLQLVEDCLQDAIESALIHWGRSGLPSAPSAWLMRTARRKAIDRIRRAVNFRHKAKELEALLALEDRAEPDETPESIPDERLKLIFACCHPALDRQVSVALTLRSICGLTTEEIARAYLVGTDAMAQRLVRARHKIARAGIGYEVPGPEGFAARLEAVLNVIYLIFNAGYAGASDTYLRVSFAEEAIRLAQLLDTLVPHEPEIEGLGALLGLHHARRAARLTAEGDLVPLEHQDRTVWDHAAIAAHKEALVRALRRGRPGLYQLQAAIAAVHAEAPSFSQTDWQEIVLIYSELIRRSPNPVYEVNRAVAVSYVAGPGEALRLAEPLGKHLSRYQPYQAALADLNARLGNTEAAAKAYNLAIALATSATERNYLARQRASLA
ncbi:RNA polymerase sigma factor [Devosia sp.]|uniref:RNA polymerase sigma factor n=1 Tax=Devosia sp. TaxID=1871048 RepID=UPI003A8DBA1B